MLQIGLPNHRKYCTPLQALYWLVEDERVPLVAQILADYDLKNLLRYAWPSPKWLSEHPELLPNFKQRWDDMDTVVDRLNSPELIDYYEKRYFKYVHHKASKCTAEMLFAKKEGNCYGHASFTIICLRKAGYDAWELKVPGHGTVILKIGGKYYALDNARNIDKKKIGFAGPFDNMKDLILKFKYY